MTKDKKLNAYRSSMTKKAEERRIVNPMLNLKIGESVTYFLNSDDSIYSQIQRLESICDEFNYTIANRRLEREKILQHAYLGCVISSTENKDYVYKDLEKYVDGIRERLSRNTFDIGTTVKELFNSSFR